MSHYTIHEWRRHGVRPCEYLHDSGDRECTIQVSGLCHTVPRSAVFATAAMALDAAHEQRNRVAAQQINYWSRFAQKSVVVTG